MNIVIFAVYTFRVVNIWLFSNSVYNLDIILHLRKENTFPYKGMINIHYQVRKMFILKHDSNL